MIEVMQAHPITTFVMLFSFLVAPMYWFLILPVKKAASLGFATMAFGALMGTLSVYNVPASIGPAGGLIILVAWLLPSTLILLNKNYFQTDKLKNLVGLQIFRLIGGFFILEMFRGLIPGSFAWPAGIGDIITGLLALYIFIRFKNPPRKWLILLIIVGVVDFISAFFFGFTSLEGPLQLFAVGFDNQTNLFPTGLIPFFLVPYAIAYHAISLINLPKK